MQLRRRAEPAALSLDRQATRRKGSEPEALWLLLRQKMVSVREGERDTCVGPSEQAGTVHGRAELAVAVWKRFGVSGQRVNNEQ